MDYGNFDTDAFISDIKIHECIWNYRSELYSDRIGKNNAWVAICGKYVENFHEKTTSDKNKIGKFNIYLLLLKILYSAALPF